MAGGDSGGRGMAGHSRKMAGENRGLKEGKEGARKEGNNGYGRATTPYFVPYFVTLALQQAEEPSKPS